MRGGRRAVEKGKAREREVVRLLRVSFPRAARTGHAQGEGGAHRRPDVDGVPGVWLSVKGGRSPRVLDAVDEAHKAMPYPREVRFGFYDPMPVVAFRRDGQGTWTAAIPLNTFRELLAFWQEGHP